MKESEKEEVLESLEDAQSESVDSNEFQGVEILFPKNPEYVN